MGGKRKLADTIIPLFPEHECYVEVFSGAAAIFFLKQSSKVEVLNDINGDIINLYRVVKYHLEELYKQFKWLLSSRESFENFQKQSPETLTDVQRAVRFLYLQKQAFGGRYEGQTFGTATTSRPRFNILTLEQDLTEAHYRLANAIIERLDWQEVVRRYDRPHTLFYCDPPYWQTAGYGVNFDWSNYKKMADFASSMQGQIVISINDHPDIRRLFGGLKGIKIDHEYTVCGNGNTQEVVELVYGNWREGIPSKTQNSLF